MKPAKKKPARKTVTAWVWSVSDGGATIATVANFHNDAREQRMTDKLSGYTVGPITRIEVPLPEGK